MSTNRLLLALTVVFGGLPLGVAAQTAPEQDIVWPMPPEAPRVRYEGVLYSEHDLGKKGSFFGSIAGALVGARQRMLTVQRPHDVWVDDDGRMFVTNGLESGFWLFDPDEKEARLINPGGSAGVGKPMGIMGDGRGNLFLADTRTKRVVAVTYEGDLVAAFGGTDVLLNPVDVALSPSGHRVYVADSYLHQVLIFDRDSGELLRRLGKHEGILANKEARKLATTHGLPSATDGHEAAAAAEAPTVPGHDQPPTEPSDLWENRSVEDGEFRYPAFVATGADGRLYVSDGMNFRVQIFDEDGEFIGKFGRMGDVPGAFTRPKGVDVDSEGHIYVVDAAFNNVQIFDGEGQLLLTFGGFGNGAGQLWLPTGISIDDEDRIFVADRYNSRIQVFRYLSAPEGLEGEPAEEPTEGTDR